MFSQWMFFFTPPVAAQQQDKAVDNFLSQLSAEIREFVQSIVAKVDQRAPLTFGELVYQHDTLAHLNRYDRVLKATKDSEKILSCIRSLQSKVASILNADAHEKLVLWENQLKKFSLNQETHIPAWVRYLNYK